MRRHTRRLMFFISAVAMFYVTGYAISGSTPVSTRKNIKLHHLHVMMNHGLSMVTEGSNMVMLSGMKMAPSLDKKTMRHGQIMIARGKKVVKRALKGPEMTEVAKEIKGPSELLAYTAALGEAIMNVIHILEKMDIDHMSSAEYMDLHHEHIALNHALQMAAEGANLVMLWQMGMADEVDRFSLDHGKEMISSSRNFYEEVIKSYEADKSFSVRISSGRSSLIKMTEELSEAELKVIDLLSEMPTGEKM